MKKADRAGQGPVRAARRGGPPVPGPRPRPAADRRARRSRSAEFGRIPTSRASISTRQALAELAASIAERGRAPADPGPRRRTTAIEIVAGERRWRAAQKARLHEIPALDPRVRRGIERRDRADREYPARGPQRDRGSRGLSPADRPLRPQPGGGRQAGRQVAQPCRQPVEIARSARSGALNAVARRYQHGPCPRVATAPDPEALAQRDRRRRPVGAPGRAAGQARRPGAGTRHRPRVGAQCRRRSMPISPRSSASSATCSGSRSRSATARAAARSRFITARSTSST